MAKQRSIRLRDLADLVSEGNLHRFFEWKRPRCVLFLLEKALHAPKGSTLALVEADYDIPLVKLYYLAPDGDSVNYVGYAIRTPPEAEEKVTAAYLHVGAASGGEYEAHSGLKGMQIYVGDADAILVSTAAGDGYIDKVRADVIV